MKRKNLFVFVIMSICLFSSCIIEGGYYSNLEDNTVYEISNSRDLQNFLNDTKKAKAKIMNDFDVQNALYLGQKVKEKGDYNHTENLKLPSKEINLDGHYIKTQKQVFIVNYGCTLSLWNSDSEFFGELLSDSNEVGIIENYGTLYVESGILIHSCYLGLDNYGLVKKLNCNFLTETDDEAYYAYTDYLFCIYNNPTGKIEKIKSDEIYLENYKTNSCCILKNEGYIVSIESGIFDLYYNSSSTNFYGLFNDEEAVIDYISSEVNFTGCYNVNYGTIKKNYASFDPVLINY